MAWKTMAAAAAALAAGCSNPSAAPADNRTEAAAPAPAPEPGNPDPVVRRFSKTMSGQQPLKRPPEPFELLTTQITYPTNHVIPCHRHSWPRYVYVQEGRLRVTNFEAGETQEAGAGEILVEAINQWHQGDVVQRVKLVVFEQVPPGGENIFPAPPPPPGPCRRQGQ